MKTHVRFLAAAAVLGSLAAQPALGFSCGNKPVNCPPNMRCAAAPAGIGVGIKNKSAYSVRVKIHGRDQASGKKRVHTLASVAAGKTHAPVCVENAGFGIDHIAFQWKDGLKWRDWSVNFPLSPGDHVFKVKGKLFQGVTSIQ